MFIRRSRSWLALVTVVLLTGCGAPTSRRESPAPPSGTPIDLIGLWRLEAAGEAPGTALRIGKDLSIWRRCSESWGQWAASAEGGFLADLSSYSYACGGPKPTTPPKPEVPPAPLPPAWLTSASGYRIEGADRIFVDAAGRTVARLSPGGKPFPNANVAADLSAPPSLDNQLVKQLQVPIRLPSSLSAATSADVIGTWHSQPPPAAAAPPVRSFTTFKADGSWTGSDGCNTLAGRWSLGRGGSLLAISGAETLVGCTGQDQVPRLTAARRLGFAGSVLTLVDANGVDIGHLVRG